MLRGKMLKVRQQYLREMEERNYEGTYVQCPTVPTGHLYVNGGLYQVRVITVFTVFRLLTDFVCLYNYEFGLSLCKIVRSSVILLLPLLRCLLSILRLHIGSLILHDGYG
jgi:hypothetical protein